jgi:hypothetical protein
MRKGTEMNFKSLNFDRKNLNTLRAEMDALLKKYGVESNLEFTIGNMRFSDTEVDIKVKAKISGAPSRSEQALGPIMRQYDFKQIGRDGRKLVEYKKRNHKYPFIFEYTGKRFKCSYEKAKMYFAA